MKKHIRILTVLIFLVLTSVIKPVILFSDILSTGDTILFMSNRDGNNEIYIMDADGSNQTRLTNNMAVDAFPSWSPDGSKIVFYSERDSNGEIYTMNSDGSNQIRLTYNSAKEFYPRWSPDGSQIVFNSNRDANYEIYVMNIDGSNQIRLTDNGVIDQFPSWSPDGSQIAFESFRDGSEEIYIMNSDGTNPTRITYNPGGNISPVWSPDGSQFVFSSGRDGNEEIYVMNVDGSNQIRLTNDPDMDSKPKWSPDGSKITFHSKRDGDREIYVMNSDGSNQACLSNNIATDQYPDWARPIYVAPEVIDLISPNGGEKYIVGAVVEITWTVENVTNDLVVELSDDNGETWALIAEDIDPVSESYLWLVPDAESTECLIRITNSEVTDTSDAPFRIISVETVISELIEYIIEDENISGGLENSLTKKLGNVLDKLERGNITAAINQLEAFINQVEAKRGKKNGLTDVQADELIAIVQQIISLNSSTAKQALSQRLPDSFILSQNYPNPFNPTTTIEYSIPHDGLVTLSIYNTVGQEIAVLVNDRQEVGSYSVVWDASGMPSGLYFSTLKTDDAYGFNKMLLMK